MGLADRNDDADFSSLPVTELWQLFKNGSEDAYAKIYDLYFDLLFHYGIKLSVNHDLVKDSIHELFIDIWRKRERLGNPDSIKNYLIKSLRRRIYRKKTAKSHIYNQELLDNCNQLVEDSAEFKLINLQTRTARSSNLKKAIQILPERQQEVIFLKFYAELNYQQIAATMNISIPAIYNLLSKAIKTLRSQIKIKQILISISTFLALQFLCL